ncbi:hypothetical protein AB1N83_009992 [Pleurotus pulmonarius]
MVYEGRDAGLGGGTRTAGLRRRRHEIRVVQRRVTVEAHIYALDISSSRSPILRPPYVGSLPPSPRPPSYTLSGLGYEWETYAESKLQTNPHDPETLRLRRGAPRAALPHIDHGLGELPAHVELTRRENDAREGASPLVDTLPSPREGKGGREEYMKLLVEET